MPRQSCALVSPADVARYLPGAKGTARSGGRSSTVEDATCKWSAAADGKDQTLVAEAVVFRSASSISQARAAYRATVTELRCHCPGVTVRSKPAAGLGDQATDLFIVAGPDATLSKAPSASAPGASLLVMSSNTVISIYLDITTTATGESQTSPPSSAQLTGMIAMARDGLAALDDPAASAFPRGISYASPRDPCQLVTASTRARYAGGATGQQQSGGGVIGSGESSDSTCAWFAPDGALFMDATIYTSIDNAQGDISPASSSRGIIPAASSRDHSR